MVRRAWASDHDEIVRAAPQSDRFPGDSVVAGTHRLLSWIKPVDSLVLMLTVWRVSILIIVAKEPLMEQRVCVKKAPGRDVFEALPMAVMRRGSILLLGFLLAMPAWSADQRTAKVNFIIAGTILAVEDGDTLTLRGTGGDRFHVRLSDLDAPEVAHGHNPYRERRGCRGAPASAPSQVGGDSARAALATRATVEAAARAECYVIDHYGRPICHVFVAATNLNVEQLRDGWATLLTKRSWIRDPASVAAAQTARQARRGIWAEASPQAPASWRQACWCRAKCPPHGR